MRGHPIIDVSSRPITELKIINRGEKFVLGYASRGNVYV